jgi:hypothetical protein
VRSHGKADGPFRGDMHRFRLKLAKPPAHHGLHAQRVVKPSGVSIRTS